MAKKFGPAYGPKAKKAIKAMIASGEVVKITAKRGRKPKVAANVKAYVDKAIDRNSEDKHMLKNVFSAANCLAGGFDSTATNVGLTTTDSIIPLVIQGTAVSNRIGNKINVKSLMVRLMLEARPVTTTNSVEGLPFYVRVVFYNRKDSMTNYTNNTILDLAGTSTSFTYQNQSLLLKYNTDLFNIISSKTYKMAPCQGESGGVTSERQPPNGFASHVLKQFKLKIPKKLIYDDTSSQPNHRIYCAIGVVNADGTQVLPALNGTRLQVSLDSHLVYEDS